MIDYKYADLYKEDSIDKQVKIEYDGGTITNEELFSESIELTESLCSEAELRFGCCEASVLKFKIANVSIPLANKWITVSETLTGNTDAPFAIGKYKVFSDKPTADRRYREIEAYDAMYDILNTDVAEWYNSVLPLEGSAISLKKFRTSFIQHFGLEQEETELINDNMPVFKTIEPSELSGKDVITAICEINGCFGHIGRDGKFHYIYLEQDIQGLYPRDDLFPADDLYPRDPKTTGIGKGLYISCKYEDYLVRTINKLQIRKEENDIGVISGSGDNCYIVEDNFLVYGMDSDNLGKIADKLRMKIQGIVYRPFEADCKGNPRLEVGDAIRLPTKYELVETYILKRTLKGIQALRDTYSSEGAEFRTGKVNGIQKSIIQLRGKTNVLTRTIEETKSTITDVEAGLQSEIRQTATEIQTEVRNTKEGLQSQITQTAESIESEVTRATGAEETLSSRIKQTASDIKLEVERAQKAESAITLTADSISLEVKKKVGKSEVISSINQTAEEIKIAAQKISLNGAVTANNNVKISTDGKITAKNANIEGKIKSSSATITGGTFRVVTESSDENLIWIKSLYDSKELMAAMSAYGVTASYGGVAATFMWNGLKMAGNGYLTTDGSKSLVGATEGYIGTLVTNSSSGTASDRRLKNSIRELDRNVSADFIYSLIGYEFKYNNGTSDRLHHGLIAQQLKETMGDHDWGVYMDGVQVGESDERYMAIRYEELIADLIATVQSQNERIKKLEEREEKRWSKRITALIGKITQAIKHHLMNRISIK